MDIRDKISENAIEKMRGEIEFASGNEVFFRGIPDSNLIVVEVEVLARGNESSVPAILRQMKKGEVIIHNHPSGYLYPSDNDVQISAMYSEKKKGASYIVNNAVDDIYCVVELAEEKVEKIDIGPYFEEKGLLSSVFEGFEYRHEQYEMAKHIEDGINSGKKVVVEAGTGTGKTLAYLIPSIEWAVKNEKKVIISTNTINLQEQLLNKDIPVVKKVLEHDFKYALIKGRGNYACWRKYDQLQKGELVDLSELSPSQKNQVESVVQWIEHTESGDRGELSFEVEGIVWEFFSSENDMCAMTKCPRREACFFMKSRQDKADADVLITNHHLYFADLAIRKDIGFDSNYGIIPQYDLVVFDEAHNIEKVARDYFSYEVSRYALSKIMNNIYRNASGKKKKMGSLTILTNFLRNTLKKNNKKYKEIKEYIDEEIIMSHSSLLNKAGDYFAKLMEAYCREGISTSMRLRPEKLKEDRTWVEEIMIREEELFISYVSYMKKLRKLLKELKDYDDETGVIRDFEKYTDRLDSYFTNFKFVTEMADDNYIYWLSANPNKGHIKIVATPLKINNELEEVLYSNLDHIIFTSATIAIDDEFSYFKKSIGLKDRTLDKVIKSPFDYDKQMKVYIPKDIPMPNNKEFLTDISSFIIRLIEAAGGNTFLLFTSYSTLNYTYYLIREELEKMGHNLFIQGMAPRNKLIDMYKVSPKPVLFGTDSFWEGVDVKGEKLSSVIIVKLPFKVPSDPVVEAIIENMEKEGRNSFMEYQIPESIIKFKQGIGRLIRSKDDRGIITILDSRLYTKYYGKKFVNAIPTKNIFFRNRDEIV